MTSSTRSLTLQCDAALLDKFEAYALTNGLDLNAAIQLALRSVIAAPASSTATDQAARDALTKLKERTEALENLTRQMTTHMRMLQEEVDSLKRPATPSQDQLMAEMLPTVTDDFAADF